MERYVRNMKTLSKEENDNLKNFKVCVVGCGGIGGYVIEMLGRIGIGSITAVDGDVFEESNLNRQILSSTDTIGFSKALEAKLRMEKVNPLIEVKALGKMLLEDNACSILSNHDVVVDALDSIPARLLLQRSCKKLNIPMVHGAIAGWYAQVTTIFPGDDTLNKIYNVDKQTAKGIEKEMGNPSFTPALAASIEVSEVIKILLGRGELLRKKMAFMDLLSSEYEIVPLG
ncbi:MULTISPECIES: HesA/MoeB/ThiF family protein [Clostridium]|uniref:Adenylyltransferase/sulfurtransferase MoeZ n=3 Tax=Clostridium TaxID=1485 RepID=D8GJ10_CLOLD|nr:MULTISPECIES: HesA/MoeB/ThiF family protein [Clostridium]ADK15085.1 predicted dinucleotide-utilizing enzymes involved in molybdopterin and thiamine biosynthesis, ThiF [Clostridium ljungdahlii DSM 13528]AGY74339.1 HesA/MoeB/ThiF family protein [Clostridium autoethanogenum DSM 10061]ALU34530.1 UBA/THIF-type NAD/FAD binding protein [Clostridium autoethanogenum DSM 10061]OAA83797.1 putative adenylyltransferase/sulfurtransferase MoeZ [Clostridium ljungdahlii DSM 13528]OVY51250.1 putative adenyly